MGKYLDGEGIETLLRLLESYGRYSGKEYYHITPMYNPYQCISIGRAYHVISTDGSGVDPNFSTDHHVDYGTYSNPYKYFDIPTPAFTISGLRGCSVFNTEGVEPNMSGVQEFLQKFQSDEYGIALYKYVFSLKKPWYTYSDDLTDPNIRDIHRRQHWKIVHIQPVQILWGVAKIGGWYLGERNLYFTTPEKWQCPGKTGLLIAPLPVNSQRLDISSSKTFPIGNILGRINLRKCAFFATTKKGQRFASPKQKYGWALVKKQQTGKHWSWERISNLVGWEFHAKMKILNPGNGHKVGFAYNGFNCIKTEDLLIGLHQKPIDIP